MTARPTPLPVRIEGIPESLRAERRWVIWHYVWKEKTDGKPGKWDKPPYIATAPERPADSTNPTTWRTFADALGAYEDGKCDGIGFVLGDGLVGFDADGTNAPEFVDLLNTYTERSPSGAGVHAIARGTKPGTRCRIGDYELYDHGRYFTVTGHHVDGTPRTVENRTPEIAALYARLFPTSRPESAATAPTSSTILDDELIALAKGGKNGAKFETLWSGDTTDYPSHSEADLALCAILAFWTNRNAEQMNRLFRRSGLMREKWDSQRGDSTIGAILISKAISATLSGYTRGQGPQRAGNHKLHPCGLLRFSGGAATDFIAAEASKVFEMHDGKTTANEFSPVDPASPLSIEEWMHRQMAEKDYVFNPSRGGGAPPRNAPAFGARFNQKILKNPSATELGANASAIARGDIKVEHS